MKSISIRLEDNIAEQMRLISIEERRTLNTIYTIAVEEYLKNRGVKIEVAAVPVPQISKNESAPSAPPIKVAKQASKAEDQKQLGNSAANHKNKAVKMIKQQDGSWLPADKAQDTPTIDTTELAAINEPNTEDEF